MRVCFLVTISLKVWGKMHEDVVYILLRLIVQHCGYILIHMGQRYPKNMYILRVCL